MYIKEVKIVNFRGINYTFNDLKETFLIIGKNDSGKSNFCHALRKVLDYKVRKQPLVESDSTNSNKQDIEIKIKLDIDKISDNNRALIGEYIEGSDKKGETFTVILKAKFNEDTQTYDEELFYGEEDPVKKISANGNQLDKVLEFIYVYPSYDLTRDTKEYFEFHKRKNNKKEISMSEDIFKSVERLNESIAADSSIKTMQEELNGSDLVRGMLGDTAFEVQSDLEISNIYKSLKIMPSNKGVEINIGDGKSKTLALLLQKLTKETTKEKIIILEEPENHLFPLMQKQYASMVEKFKFGQTIITTHSPNIVDFRKSKEIIKFNFEIEGSTKKFKIFRVNIEKKQIFKDFGYALNEEIAESFFYDEVLLVEGYSEKLFYNRLINNDDEFREQIQKRSFGFICVYGVDFKPSKNILESLGIKVHVLTDDDFIKIPKKVGHFRFAGMQRAFKLLAPEQVTNLNKKFNKEFTNDFFKVEKDSMRHQEILGIKSEILEELKIYNLYLNPLEGFERSFVDFIKIKESEKANVIKELSVQKMKRLHKYMIENEIEPLVDKENEGNILVGFIYE